MFSSGWMGGKDREEEAGYGPHIGDGRRRGIENSVGRVREGNMRYPTKVFVGSPVANWSGLAGTTQLGPAQPVLHN